MNHQPAEAAVVATNAAGVSIVDKKNMLVLAPRYALNAAAALWIEQPVNPKRIQRWMGHSSIQILFHGINTDRPDRQLAVVVRDDVCRARATDTVA